MTKEELQQTAKTLYLDAHGIWDSSKHPSLWGPTTDTRFRENRQGEISCYIYQGRMVWTRDKGWREPLV